MSNPFEKFYNTGTWRTLVMNLVSGTLLLLAAAWFSYNLFAARDAGQPVRVINSLRVEPAILLPGHPFTVYVNVTLTKLCPWEVQWSLARKTDGVQVVKIVEPVRPPAEKTGTQDLAPVTRFLPQTVEPGEYRYISEEFDQCPGAPTNISVRRDQLITVR